MVELKPLEASDKEQFIKDNQEAFNYGALEEFGMRDNHFEEDEQDGLVPICDFRLSQQSVGYNLRFVE